MIRRALDAGVEFIDENVGGPGVRLLKRQPLKIVLSEIEGGELEAQVRRGGFGPYHTASVGTEVHD